MKISRLIAVVAAAWRRWPWSRWRAQAQAIKIGELNSYKVFPAFLEPYKKGWELALEEINAAAASTAASSRSCRATTAAIRATRCASPRS